MHNIQWYLQGFCNPKKAIGVIFCPLLSKLIKNDKIYIYFRWWCFMPYKLNLNNPQTFNEKLNWLKLNDHNPIYHILADKYEVKTYVDDKIGNRYIAKCYGVWNSFDEIDFDSLPNQFVLKATHDSSGATICKNKATFDLVSAKKKFDKVLNINYYLSKREWGYKDIKPRIIAEEFLDDHTGHELRDYKFWCFNGEPKVMYITNKGTDIKENFYDMDFKPLDINHDFPRRIPEYDMTTEFEEMKQLAAMLSKDIPFVRIDFFDVEGHVYFGEFTLYDWGGLKSFSDINWDYQLGTYIKLPNIK